MKNKRDAYRLPCLASTQGPTRFSNAVFSLSRLSGSLEQATNELCAMHVKRLISLVSAREIPTKLNFPLFVRMFRLKATLRRSSSKYSSLEVGVQSYHHQARLSLFFYAFARCPSLHCSALSLLFSASKLDRWPS